VGVIDRDEKRAQSREVPAEAVEAMEDREGTMVGGSAADPLWLRPQPANVHGHGGKARRALEQRRTLARGRRGQSWINNLAGNPVRDVPPEEALPRALTTPNPRSRARARAARTRLVRSQSPPRQRPVTLRPPHSQARACARVSPFASVPRFSHRRQRRTRRAEVFSRAARSETAHCEENECVERRSRAGDECRPRGVRKSGLASDPSQLTRSGGRGARPPGQARSK
jgi:hypothetical protein